MSCAEASNPEADIQHPQIKNDSTVKALTSIPFRNCRTSGKGRAALTFVVPSSYFFIKFKDPTKPQRLPFVNGEPLLVDATVDTAVRRHGESRHLIAIALGRAVAEVLPAP